MNNNFDPFSNFSSNQTFDFNTDNSITDLSSDSDNDTTLNTLIQTNSDNDLNLLNKLTLLYNKYEKKLKDTNEKKRN